MVLCTSQFDIVWDCIIGSTFVYRYLIHLSHFILFMHPLLVSSNASFHTPMVSIGLPNGLLRSRSIKSFKFVRCSQWLGKDREDFKWCLLLFEIRNRDGLHAGEIKFSLHLRFPALRFLSFWQLNYIGPIKIKSWNWSKILALSFISCTTRQRFLGGIAV